MIKWVQNQSIGLRLCFAFAYCAFFYALQFLFDGSTREAVTLVLFCVFPFFYGLGVQLVFDPKMRETIARLMLWGLLPVVLLSAALLIVQFETLICIAILLPMFCVLMALGVLLMRWLLRRNVLPYDSTTFNVSVLLVPVLFLPLMGQVNLPTGQYTVTTQIEIAAPRDVVWANTYAIDPIQDNERQWTFSHNILRTPLPIDARVSGDVRQLRWSGGIRFQEHLTNVDVNTSLAWNFVFNAPKTLRSFDPHIAPQGSILHLKRGAYTLTDLPNGNTELTLHTHYSLSSPANGYLALWGEVFLQDFHGAVLAVIKSRSENGQRKQNDTHSS
jgi:hypothetical protein